MTIEEVLAFDEMQIFDRKSIHIEPRSLAVTIVAFANADGGTVALGISDKTRRIEGTDYDIRRLNELLTVPYDLCEPTVQVAIEKVPCIDDKGRDNHIVLMHIEPSSHVHANQADEVYLRVGDKSKRLGFNDCLQLTYDKGERFFEDKPVSGAELDDLDIDLVREYIRKIGYQKDAMAYLTENKGFVKKKEGKMQISTAAILLFGKDPQNFFPRAHIRFIRYEGTDIQIKMLDDRIVVESPRKLSGLVRADDIRSTHFSRNPKIAEFLKAYSYVKGYGEGVDRMCRE